MKKDYIFILIVLFAAVGLRLYFPGNHNLTQIQIEEVTNNQGHYYLFQYDSYAFYDMAQKVIKYNDWSYSDYNFIVVNEVILNSLFPESDFIYIVSFLPILYVCLTIILLYITIRILTDQYTAFLGAFWLSINFNFLLNTYKGFVDRNPFNHFFIVTIFLCFNLALNKRQLRYYFIGSVLILGFRQTWKGYFPILMILATAIILYLFINKKIVPFKIPFIICSLLIIAFIYLNRYILLTYLKLNLNNKFTVIEEIATPDFNIHKLLFFVTLMGYMLYKINENPKNKQLYTIGLWGFSMGIASFIALRHTFYWIIPSIIISCMIVYEFNQRFFKKYHTTIILVLFLPLVFINIIPICTSDYVPEMDDSIYNSMQIIKNTSPQNSLIISHWDYGIIYQTFSEREALYKSVMPGDKSIYLALLEDNETIAYNIIRSFSNRPEYLVVNSEDIRRIPTIEKALDIKIKKNSLIWKAIREEPLNYFSKVVCEQTSFKKICVYEVK